MSSLDRILIAFLMLTSLLIAPAMLVSSPYRGGPGLAVIPPWANIDQTLANAGLREIAPYRPLSGFWSRQAHTRIFLNYGQMASGPCSTGL